ncbi:MAG: hypothetical protein ACRDFB_01210, partial [Rhabdochlamydiaceae bacterium]
MSMTKKLRAAIKPKHLISYQIDSMLTTIKSHPAWKEGINLIRCEALLQDCLPFTYILCEGDSAYQFFLSYMNENRKVKHVPFKIELTIRKWLYRNGT